MCKLICISLIDQSCFEVAQSVRSFVSCFFDPSKQGKVELFHGLYTFALHTLMDGVKRKRDKIAMDCTLGAAG